MKNASVTTLAEQSNFRQTGRIDEVERLSHELAQTWPEAVMSFEYGFSLESPNNLVIWEAQFGDFHNSAQVVLDTLVTSSERKWLLQTGLVILLPHGMDGAGPEHSSSRIERFLQMCDSKEEGDQMDSEDVNFRFANPTTSAQYFHLLRRQMLPNYRKPLVVASPKIILRLAEASSTLEDMGPTASFQPVLPPMKSAADPGKIKRVILCSGKHYFALENKRTELKKDDVVILRIEQLCPFPAAELAKELARYSNAKEYIWAQEEHQNMGAWSFVKPRVRNFLNIDLRYSGRTPLGACAVGVSTVHKKQVEAILSEPFK